MLVFLYIAAFVYLVLLVGLFTMQRSLIYLPDTRIGAPEEYGLEKFTDFSIDSTDGLKLQLWHREAAAGFPTVIYFHGNAANLGNRAPIYDALAAKGFGVLALSYRGYGKSTGQPTEQGLYNDARAAITFLITQKHVPENRIILFGESLGTGVAVQMATEFKAGMLVLEAPYTSVANRAAEIYYYIPVKWLIRDHFDSLGKISLVKMPVLILHGELDATIPPKHGRTLFTAASEPKRSVFFPHVGHNDFDTAEISEHVLDFAKEHKLITP